MLRQVEVGLRTDLGAPATDLARTVTSDEDFSLRIARNTINQKRTCG